MVGGGGGGGVYVWLFKKKKGWGLVAVVFIDILLSLLVASGGAIQYFLSCWGW